MIEGSRVRVPAGATGEFSSTGSTFCADPYFGSRFTAVARTNPSHFAKRAGGRLQLSYVCGFA